MNGWLSWKHIKKNGIKVKGPDRRIFTTLIQAYRNGLVTLNEMGAIFEAIIASDDIWIASGLCREVLNRLKSEPRDYKDGVDL